MTCQEVEDDPGQVQKYQYHTRLEESIDFRCKCCTFVGTGDESVVLSAGEVGQV